MPSDVSDTECVLKDATGVALDVRPLKTSRPMSSLFKPISLTTLLNREAVKIPWMLEGYLARGCFTMLSGPPKQGKTTFAYDVIAAVAKGDDLLGYQVAKGKTLLIGIEEHPRDIIERLRGCVGNDHADSSLVVFPPIPFEQKALDEIVAYIRQEEIALVVVDTLPAWWQLKDENAASEVLTKGAMLLTAIRNTLAAWLCIAHTRKRGGRGGEDLRGSSAILGLVDINVALKGVKGHERQRCLEAVSRYAETPRELVIERSDGTYVALGSASNISKDQRDKVWNAVSGEARSASDIEKLTGISRRQVDRILVEFEAALVKTGSGAKGDSYCYRLMVTG